MRNLLASQGPQECEGWWVLLRIILPVLPCERCERSDRRRVTPLYSLWLRSVAHNGPSFRHPIVDVVRHNDARPMINNVQNCPNPGPTAGVPTTF